MDTTVEKIEALCSSKNYSAVYNFLNDSDVSDSIKSIFVKYANSNIGNGDNFLDFIVKSSLFLKLNNEYYIYDKFMSAPYVLSKNKVIAIIEKIIEYKKFDSNSGAFSTKHYRKFLDELKSNTSINPVNIEDYQLYFKTKNSNIYKKLVEYNNTGIWPLPSLSEEAKIYIQKLDVIKELENVYGIGIARAKNLATSKEFEINSVEDLIALKDNPKLNLPSAIKAGLEHYYDLQLRIPREEIDIYNNIIQLFMSRFNLENGAKYEIVGSYKRGLPNSGDIDIIVNNKKAYNLLIKTFDRFKITKATLSQGEIKTLLITSLNSDLPPIPNNKGIPYPSRRMDIMYSPPNEYPFATLYFTGSKEFNTRQRSIALSKGWSLNEHGFTSTMLEEDYITFWSGKKQFSELSNFYQSPITINGRTYQGGEQAFHGEKFRVVAEFEKDEEVKKNLIKHAEQFLNITEPDVAKKTGGKGNYGYALTPEQIELWNSKAEDVQFAICLEKLKDPAVLEALKNSGNKHLYHYFFRAKPDEFWGWKKDKTTGREIGANRLGEIWMAIREQTFPGMSNKSRELPVFRSEEDIFEFLGMEFLEAPERIE
jgi:ribA/ribD-fused uncharacterized protein